MKTKINFRNIDYLRKGNDKQKQAYEVLTKNEIMTRLKDFDPILVGTIPINIYLENSDLDIVCQFLDSNGFKRYLARKFGGYEKFKIWENTLQETSAIVANFFIDGFEVEIFGQNIPTNEQQGYRHMLIEYNLIEERGDRFRKRIIELKEKGYKTEPAFAFQLDLEGDPYKSLLELEK